ncbi:M23 family metallopeptidase [Methylomicrobium sp. Wu6]|uniref:M23 family metallopeptidase n=1 Tax=Methylomicrobium sp. Wu6 TaxID=3107928 RepID=UPI002DD68509|nr:M23 family metallopeptidase [Methylomicrobium sp. Wu6]MEC4748267.1 M23 family metallopeptidase [Methylomicrobium sp. Wu6]
MSYIQGTITTEPDQQYIASLEQVETETSRISTTLYPLAKSRLHIQKTNLQEGPRFGTVRTSSDIISSRNHSLGYLESHTPLESKKLSGVYGVIETDLADAGHKAGLSDELIDELTRIFAWDIDFASNLHAGDQFTVLYKNSPDASDSKAQHIYAAEFVSQGKFLTAVRFEDAEGNASYYTPEGNSLHKAFLSTPVDYARISSHFNTHRKHPVLNRIRAHKGVDYAARTGTPVKAAGDGEVTFQGRKGGYGQVLILKHGDHYETLYAHLSGFKRGLNDGDHVMQGEVIGYVGQTGLATGPHLHYEFRKDGVHQNPESLEFKRPMRVDNQQLAEFKDQTKPLLAKLYQTKSRNLLAKNQ